MVHPLTWATSTGQIPNNLHYHKSGTTLPQNIQISRYTQKNRALYFFSLNSHSPPGVKIPKREHPQFSLPIFLSSLELSWLSKGNSKQKNCRRLLGWISSLHRMPIYRHSLKKQTRALAMIYGKKKKKVPPIVEDQPTTSYGIKLCLQLWKTNHHGNGPQNLNLNIISKSKSYKFELLEKTKSSICYTASPPIIISSRPLIEQRKNHRVHECCRLFILIRLGINSSKVYRRLTNN